MCFRQNWEAELIIEIIHIQNTAPGPPNAIVIAIPVIFPVPTRIAIPIQTLEKERFDL